MTAFAHPHKIAILAASGVAEAEMTVIQRALAAEKIFATIISPEGGLINSWHGDANGGTWGHSFPADAKLETSLGSDFDMLILPGGQRNVDKLMANPHTRRFVSAFFAMRKPVAAFMEAATILDTYALEGENAVLLRHEDAETMIVAAGDMIAHFKKYDQSSMMDGDAQAA